MQVQSSSKWGLALAVLTWCGMAMAAPAGAPDEAAPAIPEGYVRVPSGFAHRNCIFEVENGAQVDDTGSVIKPNGARTRLPQCAHPFIREHAQHRASPQLPTVNGWVEAAWWSASSSPSALGAYFWVPNPPATNNGQLIYLFPSLEPADGSKIVQPVLQWGVSPAGGGYYWALASWVVWSNGTAIHSPLVAVSPGHQIRGNPYGTGCSGSVCSSWTIFSQDVTTGAVTQFTHTGNTNVLNQVQGAVLEGYNVQVCSDYPASPTSFREIHVRNFANNIITPSWSRYFWVSGCAYNVGVNAWDSVDLFY